MYNAGTGLFTSGDPLWGAQLGNSAYHYGYNSPLLFSDPTGLLADDIGDGSGFKSLMQLRLPFGFWRARNYRPLSQDELNSPFFSIEDIMTKIYYGPRTGTGGGGGRSSGSDKSKVTVGRTLPSILELVRLLPESETFLGFGRGVSVPGYGLVMVGPSGFVARELMPELSLADALFAIAGTKLFFGQYKAAKEQWLGRKIDGNVEQVHHIFPEQFRNKFYDLYGINIDDPWFTVVLPKDIHKWDKKHKAYNDEWRIWIDDNINASTDQLFNHAYYLMQKYFYTTPDGF